MADADFLVDSYRRWVEGEGVPCVEDFAVDLLTTPVSPWPRFDARGSVVNVKGRGDFLGLWLIEVPAGAATAPVNHLCEAIAYVISGHGSTVVQTSAGAQSFEWGPRSVFAIPLNAEYRLFNGSGSEPARIALTTSFPIMMNVLHDDAFIFNVNHEFTERLGTGRLYEGDGTPISAENKGLRRHFWETNFVPDLSSFAELKTMAWRGKGSAIRFLMADGVLHSHVSEIPGGAYKKAHRHMGGSHIYAVTGEGYSLLWYEGEAERRRIDWRHGTVYSPPDDMYHQHFNLHSEPARYFAVKMGNYRYPVTSRMESQMRAGAADKKARRDQIDYEDEDPEIRRIYEAEVAGARLS